MNFPIAYRCQNGTMVPTQRYAEDFKKTFSEGEMYRLEEVQARSLASHNHFFAEVHGIWQTLPEKYADKFASAEHLRKYALIKAGFRSENVMVFADHEQAVSATTLIKEIDEYAITVINHEIVTVYRAESQSLRSMGAKRFQESKEAVFRVLSELIGTSERIEA